MSVMFLWYVFDFFMKLMSIKQIMLKTDAVMNKDCINIITLNDIRYLT